MKSIEEILSKCIIDKETGCWIWQLSATKNGCGQVNLNGKTGHAHRFLYEALVGPVPEGTKLKRLCLSFKCCNPEHWGPAQPTIVDILARVRQRWRVFVLPSSCWEWTRHIQELGYGACYYDGRTRLVHRVTYAALVGPIPDDKELDHLCQNRSCCNPAHLQAVPHRENVRRGIARAAWNARKTHCPKGHPYDEQNTRLDRKGGRVCRKCHSESTAASHKAKRLENPSPFGKGKTSHSALKTHCLNGHPLSGENLYVNPQGRRECRECGREAVRQYRLRKKSES